MSSVTEESLCDTEYTFYYQPHEDDDFAHYYLDPQIPSADSHKICLENGIVMELDSSELQKIITLPTCTSIEDKPTCSKYLPHEDTNQNDTTIKLSNGIKLTMSNEKYKKYFLTPLYFPDWSVHDEDKKAVIIDTESDEEASDTDNKNKGNTSTTDDKKGKNSDDDASDSDPKNKKHRTKTEEKKGKNSDSQNAGSSTKKNSTKKNNGSESDNDEEGVEKVSTESSKKSKKRKSEKKSDVSSTNSSESLKKSPPKKKKKKTKKEKKPEKKEDSDEEGSSDEEIKKINAAAAKIPTYKSIKNLIKGHYYRVIDLHEIETSKGKTIRMKLEDEHVDDGWCFVHMPRNVLSEMFPLIEKLKQMCNSEKGLFFKFSGMKGLAFKIKFTRHPKVAPK